MIMFEGMKNTSPLLLQAILHFLEKQYPYLEANLKLKKARLKRSKKKI